MPTVCKRCHADYIECCDKCSMDNHFQDTSDNLIDRLEILIFDEIFILPKGRDLYGAVRQIHERLLNLKKTECPKEKYKSFKHLESQITSCICMCDIPIKDMSRMRSKVIREEYDKLIGCLEDRFYLEAQK